MWIYIVVGGILFYFLFTLFLTFLVHQIPRNPVEERPDWGRQIVDTRIPTAGGGSLEVWRIAPEGASRGVVVFAHGWGRNRDRMIGRARIFGQMGFTTVIHSSRDHGGSSSKRFMNAVRFAEDVEAVMKWVKEPVLLYGHSAGAAACVIAAARYPERIKLLFLEACYARTKEALMSLYRTYNPFFGYVFAPMVLVWMAVFYGFRMDEVSPERLAPSLDFPVLIIHGEKDESFPVAYAWRLKDSFPAGRAEIFVGKEADHSSASLAPDYPSAIEAFLNRHFPLLPGED